MVQKFMRFAAFSSILATATISFADVRIQGAGSTFVNPIYQRWVTEYQKLHADVRIDYQSIGSGGGIKGITEKTIDFAGSDAPMSKSEQATAGGSIVHIPTVAGAVVLAYNLPGFTGDLKLSGDVVAQIFLGTISKWNDAKIAELNPGAALPDLAIVPVTRTDGSGTTFVFTNYLGTQSQDFKDNVGLGKQVKWPVGQGGKGNEGVAAGVQGSPGAIGYIELNYAAQNHITFAQLKNKSGKFVTASTDSVAAAGAAATQSMTDSLAVSLWNQDGENVYPIAAFTYIIVYKDLGYVKDQAKAKALVEFLHWATTDGEKMAAELTYAPLADAVQQKATAAIDSLTFNGQPVK